MIEEHIFSPSEFVTGFNQLIEYNLPDVLIDGEVLEFRVSKNRWVYFKIADENASLSCFGTVYKFNLPIEDGMKVRLRASPRLHPKFNFSLNIITITPVGEGDIKKASELLMKKLQAEGLFLPDRKRQLPYAPKCVGLITSKNSSAYSDFVKILNERWSGVEVLLSDVQVQGEVAPQQIVDALTAQNQAKNPPEVIVVTRGGGSAEDLIAFNDERVVRAVALSRLPTLVAVGHEDDLSLAEMTADMRASTPSNAVQILVPDKAAVISELKSTKNHLEASLSIKLASNFNNLVQLKTELSGLMKALIKDERLRLKHNRAVLEALNPNNLLKRGFAVVTSNSSLVKSVKNLKTGQPINIRLADGKITSSINSIEVINER